MSVVAISDYEFRLLRDLIRDRFGMYYDDTKQFLLQSRLQTRLVKRGLSQFDAYYRFLTTHADREEEWDELASALSNNETYFFRERAQLDVLASQVLDESLKQAGRIHIWSSASSTGEEPYSLAMTLLESRRLAPSQINIKASDISPRALARCDEAFYRELSFRATPPDIVQKYFRPFAGGFRINDEVKRLVEFFRLNLLDARAVSSVGEMDAIFCRNVLIYFDKPTQKQVVEAFATALRPGGYLFLGHAESIMRMTDLYEPVVTPKAIYYRLKPRAAVAREAQQSVLSRGAQ
ncbi:MAG: protein-glutamate O-methyltransferase CheR [Candidatus Eremiobacteraeota bacterium]|nr:protein-glutamate O-methyltransferase CheR [Candidatus Eremiobacteraeota bacterium]